MVDAALVRAGRQPGEVSVVGNGGVQRWEDVGELTERMGVQGWMVGEELANNPRSVRVTVVGAEERELDD